MMRSLKCPCFKERLYLMGGKYSVEPRSSRGQEDPPSERECMTRRLELTKDKMENLKP